MNAFVELLAALIKLLIYVVIFVLQVLAPLMTLIFLIVTFINPNNVTMTIFYISVISYFVGYLTSSLGKKSVVPIYEKSLLDIQHPVISVLINMAILFLPSFAMALIICLFLGEFTYFLHNAIMVNWLYRIIKYFMKRKKNVYNLQQDIQSSKIYDADENDDKIVELQKKEALKICETEDSIMDYCFFESSDDDLKEEEVLVGITKAKALYKLTNNPFVKKIIDTETAVYENIQITKLFGFGPQTWDNPKFNKNSKIIADFYRYLNNKPDDKY